MYLDYDDFGLTPYNAVVKYNRIHAYTHLLYLYGI